MPEICSAWGGGGVNVVATKIAQKIGVLFQHDDLDAGTSQKKAEHHSGGSSAGDAALGMKGCRAHRIAARLDVRRMVSEEAFPAAGFCRSEGAAGPRPYMSGGYLG